MYTSSKKRRKSINWLSTEIPSSCDPNKLLEHFKSHFNPPLRPDHTTPNELRADSDNLPQFIRELQQISKNTLIDDNPPTIDEIENHINQLKNNKSNNDIDPELLKFCNDPVTLQIIHHITTNLWANNDIPEAWSNSRLKTLWKNKGSKNDPSKYRGISIGSTICKLITNIILDRLQAWYEAQLTDEQNGFRKNRGTTDGIYGIKRIQQITNRKKQLLFLLFVDLSAAFDHIPRNWLFGSIKMRFPDNPPRLFIILEQLYKQTTLTFQESNTFATTSGVRQGGPESPFLFNLYIDYVMRVFMTEAQSQNINFYKHCYRLNPRSISREDRLRMRREDLRSWGTTTLPWSGYADDLILFLVKQPDLQNSTNLLDQTFTRFGLEINALKTESMILNYPEEDYPLSIVKLRNINIKNVKTFKYLGAFIHFDQPNTGDIEINHRIQLAVSKFTEMTNLLQNFNISLMTRILFLNSYVRSRLTFACQNWNLDAKQVERLNITYRRFLRRMVRGGFRFVDETNNDYRYRINNKRLHEICGTADLATYIGRQQLEYAKHVIRMSQGRSLKLLMFNDDKYTKRGRPSKTLLDQVTEHSSLTIDKLCNRALLKR